MDPGDEPTPIPPGFGFDDPADPWLGLVREASTGAAAPEIRGLRILGEVARGGQGIVYRAVQIATGLHVALKRPLPGSTAPDGTWARMEREVSALAVLDHPSIATIQGVELVHGEPWLVTRWVEGCHVTDWARPASSPPGRDEILAVFADICSAVLHAHQRGVLHRDLKPSNLLVDADGRPHVLDFGLARFLEDPESTAAKRLTPTFAGTPSYAAPELLLSPLAVPDVRCDVYSLGVVLHELLLGCLPQERVAAASSSPVGLPEAKVAAPRLTRELEILLAKALAPDPQERYPSVEALAEDVRRYRSGRPILAHPPSLAYQLRKLAVRNKLAVASVGIALLALVSLTVASQLFASSWKRERDRAVLALQSELATQQVFDGLLDGAMAPLPPEGRSSLLARLSEQLEQAHIGLGSEPAARAISALRMGELCLARFELDSAERLLSEAIEVLDSPQTDWKGPLALALWRRGRTRNLLGQPTAALSDLERALAL